MKKGVKYWDKYEDSGLAWWLLKNNDQADEEIMIEIGIRGAYYGGPGRYFQDGPHFWRTKRRILITQRWGRDC